MRAPPNAVFISYASQDRAVATGLRDALHAVGIEVWFDQEGLTGGDVWDRRIRDQIRDCALFVPVVSAATEGRLEGYFRREWHLAADRSLDMADARPFLLPLAIDGISELNAQVPEAFLKVQWTRLPGGQITPAFLERVRSLLAGSHEIAQSSGGTALLPTPAHGGERTRRIAYLAALGIVLLFVTGYFVSRQFLWTPGGHASTGDEKSIAVLPFTDMSEKKDQEYFSDGMAEEILDILAKLPNLKVIARTSAFQFKNRIEDIRHIGELLGARYVVEGSVRRSIDHLRITSQLIDASTGTHLWSQSYERPIADVLDIQQEVASGIARALQISVGADSSQPRTRPKTPAAYENYLRGELETDGGTLGEWEHAVGDYQAALAIDPGFEPAWSGLAAIQSVMADYGYDDDSRKHFLGAREAAQRAVQLDPRSALAHAVLADVAMMDNYDWDTARREVALARELEPGNAIPLQAAAKLAIELGQSQEAVSSISRGLELDPLFSGMHQLAEYAYSCSGRYKEAEAEIRQALRTTPQLDGGQSELAMLLMAQGRTEEAMAAARQESSDIERPFAIAIMEDRLGQHAAAEALLKTMPLTGDSDLAAFYGMRGDLDRAFSYLDKALTSGTARDSANLPYLKCHVMWAPLRADKRYAAALRKMKLEP